jgi:hypothetical protein
MDTTQFTKVITDSLPVALAIIGATEGIKTLLPSVVAGIVTILVAVALGFLAGIAGVVGLTWFTGILVGFAAAGGVTLVGKIGVNK